MFQLQYLAVSGVKVCQTVLRYVTNKTDSSTLLNYTVSIL